MFTGIISSVGKVKSIQGTKNGLLLGVEKPKNWKIKAGDSISVSGVCSTVKKTGSIMFFDYMPESVAKTNLLNLKPGSLVNLEQSLKAADRLDGHIVQGHVDIAGQISSIVAEGNSYIFNVDVKDSHLLKLAAKKGAIAIEGISLTIVDAAKNKFSFKIIPYTWQHTNLFSKKAGDKVNIEFDVLAKYLQKLISK